MIGTTLQRLLTVVQGFLFAFMFSGHLPVEYYDNVKYFSYAMLLFVVPVLIVVSLGTLATMFKTDVILEQTESLTRFIQIYTDMLKNKKSYILEVIITLIVGIQMYFLYRSGYTEYALLYNLQIALGAFYIFFGISLSTMLKPVRPALLEIIEDLE